MADPIENKVEEEQIKVPPKEPPKLPASLDDIAQEVDQLSIKQEEKLEGKTSIVKKIIDIGALTGFWYAQLQILPATLFYKSLIPSFGFLVSKKRTEKKEGRKFTWAKAFRTTYLGQLMGYADVAVFSLPEYLISLSPGLFASGSAFASFTGSTLLQGLLAGTVATLMFNPLMIPAYNFVYTTLTHFRDKIGYGKAVRRIRKLPKYFKHMYETEIKGKWQEDTSNVFRVLYPWHWAQFNLHPNVWTRLAQSVLVNNKIYADAMEKRKQKTEPDANLNNAPAYSHA